MSAQQTNKKLYDAISRFGPGLGTIYRVAEEALLLAKFHLTHKHAGRVVKCQNVAKAGASLSIDMIVEEYVVKEFRKQGVKVLSEESGFSNVDEAKYFAIVDPVDGTDIAIRGMDYYAICIAFGELENGKIYLRNIKFAVVCSPIGTFYAIQGRGSFLNGTPIRTSNIQSIKGAIIRAPQKGNLRLSFANRVRSFIFLGSTALEMCLLASGHVDAYIESRRRKVFDFAAAGLIASEAGGVVKTLLGKDLTTDPIRPTTRSTLLVAANDSIFRKIKHGLSK